MREANASARRPRNAFIAARDRAASGQLARRATAGAHDVDLGRVDRSSSHERDLLSIRRPNRICGPHAAARHEVRTRPVGVHHPDPVVQVRDVSPVRRPPRVAAAREKAPTTPVRIHRVDPTTTVIGRRRARFIRQATSVRRPDRMAFVRARRTCSASSMTRRRSRPITTATVAVTTTSTSRTRGSTATAPTRCTSRGRPTTASRTFTRAGARYAKPDVPFVIIFRVFPAGHPSRGRATRPSGIGTGNPQNSS